MPSEGLSVCLSVDVCMKRVRCIAKALLVIYSTATISIISMSAIFYIAEKAHA